MIELNIIKSLFIKDNYSKYRNYIKEEFFEKELLPLLNTVDLYYKTNLNNLSTDDFNNLFFSEIKHNQEYYKNVLNTLSNKQPLESTQTLLESFRKQKLLEDISVTAYAVSEGKDSIENLQNLYGKIHQTKVDYDLPILEITEQNLLEGGATISGLRWRLKSLNRMLGSIREGDFGFFFARPETGKTAMIASEVSFMLPQLTDKDGPIIWINNEESGKKVIRRVVQAYHGITGQQLDKNLKKYTKEFLDSHNNRFVFVDNVIIDKTLIERYVDKYHPRLIVCDQLDKVYGFKADREDLRMGAIYTWFREVAKGGCTTLGICQADGSAEGTEYLTMGQVSNSKTSKSAEADFIVGIGFKDQPGYEATRYLSVIKNKLVGDTDSDPELRHGKTACRIRPEIMRYEDFE